MEQKPQRRDLRSHFEAILGHEIGEIEDSVFELRERRAVWSEEFDNGHVTSREINTTGDSTKACASFAILSVGGLTTTDGEGKAEFLLSEYWCPPQLPVAILFTFPIIFVATAQSTAPVFVTTRTSEIFVNEAVADIRVKIFTWEPGGAPAKDKLVKWFCRLPFTRVVQP